MALDIDKIREIAERVAASRGLEVVEVELRGGGKARMLRVVIDKVPGVTHEDCAIVRTRFQVRTRWRCLLRGWIGNCFVRLITIASGEV